MMSEHALDWSGTAVPRYADAAIQALIERCLNGDESAYGALYDQFASTIYRLTYSMLQHKEDAEEVLQDSFEYAFRKLDQYNPHKSAFKTWLYRIAISRCRNKRRRKWLPSISLNQIVGQEINDDQTPTPDEALVLSDEQQRVWQALAELTPKLRETAVLRYYDGLTYNEIGDILDIPSKTAESRMRLAHKALRDLLEDDFNENGEQ
jgi:RNA polymerase sigma-70 factor, ECF subfamily